MPFSKKYSDLTEQEQTIWKTALDVLTHGDTLYGEDTYHIAWALRHAIYSLDELYKQHNSAMMIIELRKDDAGYGVTFVPFNKE